MSALILLVRIHSDSARRIPPEGLRLLLSGVPGVNKHTFLTVAQGMLGNVGGIFDNLKHVFALYVWYTFVAKRYYHEVRIDLFLIMLRLV